MTYQTCALSGLAHDHSEYKSNNRVSAQWAWLSLLLRPLITLYSSLVLLVDVCCDVLRRSRGSIQSQRHNDVNENIVDEPVTSASVARQQPPGDDLADLMEHPERAPLAYQQTIDSMYMCKI